MTSTKTTQPRVDTEHAAPSAYRAMCHFDNATARLELDPLLRELIRVRASMLNGCAYCVDMHARTPAPRARQSSGSTPWRHGTRRRSSRLPSAPRSR